MTRSEIEQILARLEPFSTLDDAALKELAANVSVRTFAAKELIFLEQTEGDTAYAVVEGRVALLKTSPSGKELIVELLGAREPFGVIVLLEKQVYPLTARAQIPTTALAFGRSVIQPLFKSRPELYQSFMMLMRDRLHSSHNLARALAHDRVEVRLASVLTTIAAKSQNNARISIGRQELADLCGTTIETASRVMKGFENEGLVELSEVGAVTILNPQKIQIIAQGESI